jgi:DeoR family fructose operon transcriptional repressor
MLTEERLQRIQSLIEERKSVTTQEIVDTLGISESTVRRDFTLLDNQGRITKVRGGAMAKNDCYSTVDDAVSLRQNRNQDEKCIIARYAASLIEPNDFVYLDAGTTTERMIDYLTVKDVVFVTNAVIHARKLSLAGYTTYILGGEFKASTEAIVGVEAVACLRKYNFTKGFWGTNGVSKKCGFSTPDVKEAMVKRAAMESCAKPYVLTDSDKFSRISCVKFGEFANAVIITNQVKEKEYAHCENVVEVSRL